MASSADAGSARPEPPPEPPVARAPVVEIPPLRQSRKGWIFGALAILALATSGYWQRAALYPQLQHAGPYFPVALPGLIALKQLLFKDWRNYKPLWTRWIPFALIAISLAWAIIYQSQQIREKAAAAARAETAEQAQKTNTEIFARSFKGITDELGEIKTKVATEPLRQEIAGLQSKLLATQKALDLPKATLEFSFVPYNIVKTDKSHNAYSPVTETTLAPAADGSLHVEFTVFNTTDADAIDGEMTLQLCDICKFAKEPPEFKRLPGQLENQRNKQFDRILSKTVFYTLSADIIAPPGSGPDVAIGMYFRCKTCIRREEPYRGTIHLSQAR